jgi:catechol 2,3-dioxygenase-like lactoylglutathione lyase family enzyme
VQRLGLVTIVVGDYDEAIAYYVGVLGFELVEDTDLGSGKRWVVVAPVPVLSRQGCALLLAKAAGERQVSRIGDQTGGRVAFFLETNDFARDYHRLSQAGVRFTETPRTEPYGQVVVFEDLYGNRWDLLQLG